MLHTETIAVCCKNLRERTSAFLAAVSLTSQDFMGYDVLL